MSVIEIRKVGHTAPWATFDHQVIRFWERVDRTAENECWTWTGVIESSGYGQLGFQRKRVMAHRLAFELTRGPVPVGLQLDHLCRNRRCCNPVHLEPVTQRENVLRGVSRIARQARQTRCIRGHEFTVDRRGRRKCMACQRQLQNARNTALRTQRREAVA